MTRCLAAPRGHRDLTVNGSLRGQILLFTRSCSPLPVDLTFAQSNPVLHAGLVEPLAPLAGDRDVETFTEVFWSALHGLATLSQAGRLRPELYDQRVAILVDQFSTAP